MNLLVTDLEDIYGHNAPFVKEYYDLSQQRQPGYIRYIPLRNGLGLHTKEDLSKPNQKAIYPLFWDITTDDTYTSWINQAINPGVDDLELYGLDGNYKKAMWLNYWTLNHSQDEQRSIERCTEGVEINIDTNVQLEAIPEDYFKPLDDKFTDNEVPASYFFKATYLLSESTRISSTVVFDKKSGKEIVRFLTTHDEQENVCIPTIIATTDKRMRSKYHAYFLAHYLAVKQNVMGKGYINFMAGYPFKQVLRPQVIGTQKRIML